MQKISYNKRKSKFFEALDTQLDSDKLLLGDRIKVQFNERGYALKESIIVIESEYFLCEFTGNDISRFPSRIKALASYLHSIELRGDFVVSHEDGLCTVQALETYERQLEEQVLQSVESTTEKVALVKSRIGQGRYRQSLLDVCCRCPLTGTSDPRFLIASHIKPWRDSTNEERLDPDNGFLFAPHIDALFDKGHISFTEQGVLLISNKEIEEQLTQWQVNLSVTLRAISDRKKSYLSYHREVVFIQ